MSHSRGHKEEEYSRQVKGSRACDFSGVGVSLGGYATRFSETGRIRELVTSLFLPAPINRAGQFSLSQRASLQSIWFLQSRLQCLSSLQKWVRAVKDHSGLTLTLKLTLFTSIPLASDGAVLTFVFMCITAKQGWASCLLAS